MKPRTRNLLVFGTKALVAAILVGWLVRSGHLDFSALDIFKTRPWLLVMNLVLFSLGACVGAYRFRVLLRLATVEVPFGLLLRLQMTAFFFNVVIPGNIGGDVVKALHVARGAPASKRTTILLLVFVERLIGVSALVLMGTLITVLRPSVWSDPLLRPLASAVALLGVTTLAGGITAMVIVRKAGARLDRFAGGPSKIGRLLSQLIAAMRLLSEGPKNLLIALGASMAFHAAGMGFFTLLTRAILEREIPYGAVATVFPLGFLSLMLPISPSGLGVGHVAFDRLFEAIGLAHGATVFNVYLLGAILPGLLGIFPYLGLRRRGELPTDTDDPAAPRPPPPTPPT